MLKFSGCSCLTSGRKPKGVLHALSCKLDEQRRHVTGKGHLPNRNSAFLLKGKQFPQCECFSADRQPDRLNRTASSNQLPIRVLVEGSKPTLRQTCSWPKPRAQFAFKDSMVHGILQFTLRIAFRCVLHRYGSQDIRC